MGERARKDFRSVNGSVYGMAWLLFHGSDHLAAEVFLDKILTGEDLNAGIRRWRSGTASGRRGRTASGSTARAARLPDHAWNAFKEDRTLAKLLPPRGGLPPTTYPGLRSRPSLPRCPF